MPTKRKRGLQEDLLCLKGAINQCYINYKHGLDRSGNFNGIIIAWN